MSRLAQLNRNLDHALGALQMAKLLASGEISRLEAEGRPSQSKKNLVDALDRVTERLKDLKAHRNLHRLPEFGLNAALRVLFGALALNQTAEALEKVNEGLRAIFTACFIIDDLQLNEFAPAVLDETEVHQLGKNAGDLGQPYEYSLNEVYAPLHAAETALFQAQAEIYNEGSGADEEAFSTDVEIRSFFGTIKGILEDLGGKEPLADEAKIILAKGAKWWAEELFKASKSFLAEEGRDSAPRNALEAGRRTNRARRVLRSAHTTRAI